MGGSGGHWPPRLVSKCRSFGQFHIIWAILHQNFGQFHIFWASLRQNFGQFNIYQTVPISVKTFFFFGGHLISDKKTVSISVKTFFFFLEVTLIWTEKPIAFWIKFNVIFRAKVLSLVPPPDLFELLRHDCNCYRKRYSKLAKSSIDNS